MLALRLSEPHYLGQSPRFAPTLGLAVAKCVLPDQIIERITIEDVFKYRRASKDAYDAWSTEIESWAARVTELEPSRVEKEIPKILDMELKPKLIQYQNEMKSVRDNLFGDLIKSVSRWEVPTMSAVYFAGINLSSALGAFAALTPTIPPLVDYFLKRREVNRRNSVSYLIGVSKETF